MAQIYEQAPQTAIVLRPSFGGWLRFLKAQGRSGFTIFLLGSLLLQALIHPMVLLGLALYVGPLIVLILGWVWINTVVPYVELDGDWVRWRKLVRHGEFRLSEVGSVQVKSLRIRPRSYGSLIVRGRRGLVLYRFDPMWWSPEAIAILTQALTRGYAGSAPGRAWSSPLVSRERVTDP